MINHHHRYLDRDQTHARRAVTFILAIAAVFVGLHDAHASGLIRVSDGQNTYEGKVVALTPSNCSLMDRQGKLVHLSVAALTSLQKISPQFEPLSLSSFRQELREEFPSSYEVVGTSRYLVCATNGNAGKYAKLFESITATSSNSIASEALR